MQSRFTKYVLTAAVALAPLAVVIPDTAQAQSIVSPANDIVLSIGRGQLVTLPSIMADIFVSNDSVADVQVKSQRQLYVFGLSGGETTIYASNSAGDIVWSANVRVGSNIESVDQMLALAMPEATISVATMGSNTVLLTGTVAAPEDAAEAERLVSAFLGEGANVVSRLRMATPLQVNLQVRFAEVSRSLTRNLASNLSMVDSTSGFKFGIAQGRSATQFVPGGALGVGFEEAPANGTPVTGVSPGTTLAGTGRFLGLDILGILDAGEREGLVTTLSQPNLTALSGETAEFLAGGEFPIPLSQGLGTTTIEYKNYGVSLAYTPTVLANGRISIRVRPEVSELSTQGAVTLNGFSIPALTKRYTETSVELGSGQSMMIAGLLSTNALNTVEKLPGVGDVPILGNLFRSTSFQRGETELVIVVTPYLVEPVNDREIRLPTDGYHSPNAAQQFLLGREHNGVSGEVRPMPRSADQNLTDPAFSRNSQGDGATGRPRPSGDTARTAEAAAPGFSLN